RGVVPARDARVPLLRGGHAGRGESRAVRHPRSGVGAGGRVPGRVLGHEAPAGPARRVRPRDRYLLPWRAAVPGRVGWPVGGRLAVVGRALVHAQGHVRVRPRDLDALELRANPRRSDPGHLLEAAATRQPATADRDGTAGRSEDGQWLGGSATPSGATPTPWSRGSG